MHAQDFHVIWVSAAFLIAWTWVASKVVESLAEGRDERHPLD